MLLGVVDLGSFEVLSDHGDTFEEYVVVDESSEESTGTVPPLPPVSWFKRTKTQRHAVIRCGKFLKHCTGNDGRDREECPFFDCWDWKHEESGSKRTFRHRM